MLKRLFNKLSDAGSLQIENRKLQQENENFLKNCAFPPGHFYSVLVSVDEIKKREAEIWSEHPLQQIPGIELNAQQQIALVKSFENYYQHLPFRNEKQENLRYFFVNDYYCHTDAIFLYSMMRHYQPKKIIEIGSGFSSAVMLDTNELFLNHSVNLSFIEPYPERLHSLLKPEDKSSANVFEQDVQSVPLSEFKKLEAGDFLIVDSTHVAKTGSDVNYILFEILPILSKGVFIHFHDIFYPFEYPKDWVLQGRNWNEAYFLKSFLMYNTSFQIKLFASYLHLFHKEVFETLPLAYLNAGSSLWIQKSS